MAGLIERFWELESSHRFAELAPLFSDDAVYYDPLYGKVTGRDGIARFATNIGEVVGAAGLRTRIVDIAEDADCGWARFAMTVGDSPEITGESMYRIAAGQITAAIDQFDSLAYRSAFPGSPRQVDVVAASGVAAGAPGGGGTGQRLVRRFWEIQDQGRYSPLVDLFTDDCRFEDPSYGIMNGKAALVEFMATMDVVVPKTGGRFQLVDAAGGDEVAWSQWVFALPAGEIAGWTLHRVRDQLFTFDADFVDTAAQADLRRG
jgi:predicted SnoaL-like aldol condensation-catalyzing enzyme